MYNLLSGIFLLLFSSSLLAQNFEICGDGIDNDNNGLIDEVCQPFECDGRLYQSMRVQGEFILYEIRTNPVQFIEIANLSRAGLNTSINALAFNPLDNLMYGINPGGTQLYRIDANGDIKQLGNVLGLASGNSAGTIGANGEYWVSSYNPNDIYEIDLTTLTATKLATLGSSSADIAYNPLDGFIYGWSRDDGRLFQFDPQTLNYQLVGKTDFSYSFTSSMYFNAQGDIIAYAKSNGRPTLFKVDMQTGDFYPLGTGSESSGSDGCSCSFGVEMTKEIAQTQVNLGDTLTYTFEFYNSSFNPLYNVRFVDSLENGLVWISNVDNVNNLSINNLPSLQGASFADFTIDTLPRGRSSFVLQTHVPCDYKEDFFANQAYLTNLPSRYPLKIFSDDSKTARIQDSTVLDLRARAKIQATVHDIVCARRKGYIELELLPSPQGFSFQWGNGVQTLNNENLDLGTYPLSLTSPEGCVWDTSFTIQELFPQLSSVAQAIDISCAGFTDGRIEGLNTQGGYTPYQYRLAQGPWSKTPNFNNLTAGQYKVEIRDSLGCEDSLVIDIEAPSFDLALQAPSPGEILLGDYIDIEITQNTLSPVQYRWEPQSGLSCANCKAPRVNATSSTTYTIYGTDVEGCIDSTTWSVMVDTNSRAFIPSAFSPNGDGNNDLFIIYSAGDVEQVEQLSIYDRWENRVFHLEQFSPNLKAYAWDGRYKGQPLNTGVFLYVVEFKLKNGRRVQQSGSISLIR